MTRDTVILIFKHDEYFDLIRFIGEVYTQIIFQITLHSHTVPLPLHLDLLFLKRLMHYQYSNKIIHFIEILL